MWRFHLQNRYPVVNMLVMLGTTQVPQKPASECIQPAPSFVGTQAFQFSGGLERSGLGNSFTW
jgi:hypothetical protein